MTYAHNIAAVGGVEEWTTAYSYGEVTFDTKAEAEAYIAERTAKGHHADYALVGYKRGTTWEEKTRMGDKISTLSDMAHKVERYGDISEAAASYARKILTWVTEADERLAAREVEQAAKIAAGAVVTAGRQVIEGEITKVSWKSNDFGGAWKVTIVADNGARYWGSLPTALVDTVEWEAVEDSFKHKRIRLTGTVEPGSDDPTFGFFKRPAKAEVL
jgi:hypothetical protein